MVHMFKLRFFLSAVSALLLLTTANSCRKERFATDADDILSFSQDTILFDTVFTSLGSTTQVFKIYNTHDEKLLVSSIVLEGGSNSDFIINVDGDNGTTFSDVEILPNDSLFIFVEVTVDPNSALTPFVIEDRIVFETNGVEQDVHLVAWGQNAYFHGGIGGLQILPPNEVWNNDLPHVVYGIVAVDEGNTLTINEGTQVYVHAKSGIYCFKSCIDINGTLGNEVVFQNDRLEPSFDDIPGQWGIQLDFQVEGAGGPEIATVASGGIWLVKSPCSTIDYAILKNGGIGILVDSTGTSDFALEINNSIITNMSGVGFWANYGAHVKATNLLVSNCGETCGLFTYGGKYQIDNCSFLNYWDGGVRSTPSFALQNFFEPQQGPLQVFSVTDTRFRNCLMYGNNAQLSDFSEFVVNMENESAQQYSFLSCLVDSELDLTDPNRYAEMVVNQAPFICDNFKISQASSRMQGSSQVPGAPDLAGVFNGDWKGCYDFNGLADPCE
jgi:hypothetical protein